jgi:hypothetical protein
MTNLQQQQIHSRTSVSEPLPRSHPAVAQNQRTFILCISAYGRDAPTYAQAAAALHLLSPTVSLTFRGYSFQFPQFSTTKVLSHSEHCANCGRRAIELGYGFGGPYETQEQRDARLAHRFGSPYETQEQRDARLANRFGGPNMRQAQRDAQYGGPNWGGFGSPNMSQAQITFLNRQTQLLGQGGGA